MRRRKSILLGLGSVLAVLVGLHLLVVRSSIIVGRSMTPTLQPWDYCLTLRVRAYQPKRGDIVIFHNADPPIEHFIKRVVALPGETVAIRNGVVLLDGRPLAEPYTAPNPAWNLPATPVPANKIFVLSDNRSALPEDYVQGLVATRLVQARLVWHWRWKGHG